VPAHYRGKWLQLRQVPWLIGEFAALCWQFPALGAGVGLQTFVVAANHLIEFN